MKRIVVLLMLLLIVPPVTALAASCTSRSFVVRNWMATLSTTPASTDEVDEFETDGVETEDPADMFIPPELGYTPASTTPAFTDEVEQEEPEEQGEAVEEDDHSEPGEQSIPPAFTDAVGMEGQPATPIFTTPVSPGEVEMDEDEFVGEVEGQDGPVDDHSGEIEEASSESAEKPPESEQCEEIEPEGEEQPIP